MGKVTKRGQNRLQGRITRGIRNQRECCGGTYRTQCELKWGTEAQRGHSGGLRQRGLEGTHGTEDNTYRRGSEEDMWQGSETWGEAKRTRGRT